MIRPTREQNWLLRACLLSGRDATEAWNAWRQNVNFDEIDAASYRLIPLSYQNLRRENVDDELLGRIRGIHHFNWSRNQLLFHAAGRIVIQARAAKIPLLVLKGAALATAFYEDPGQRPMDDFDFMVRMEDVPRVSELLASNGWRWTELFTPTEALAWCHAGKWVTDHQMIDLHWRLWSEDFEPGVDDSVWSQPINVPIGGQMFPALNPAELLWHACAHGVVCTTSAQIRWVADASMVIQKTPALDWDRFVEAVERRGLTIPINDALGYLKAEFAVPVPPAVLRRLGNIKVSWAQRWAYNVKSRPPGLTGALPAYLANYYLRTRGLGWWYRLARLPGFLRHTWGLASVWHFPGSFLRRVGKRVRIHVSQKA